MPKNPHFRHLTPLIPRLIFYFKTSAVSLFLLSWPPTSSKFSGKTNEQSPRYLKTDWLTIRQGQLQWTPSGKHGVQSNQQHKVYDKKSCTPNLRTLKSHISNIIDVSLLFQSKTYISCSNSLICQTAIFCLPLQSLQHTKHV